MNIIVTNRNKDLIYGANIEIMKELNGVFQVSEIANSFNSIFYKKLIIDATAIANFPKEEVLRELAKTFDTEKLILFLPPDDPPPKKFLSLLVNINIFNFTDNVKGLQKLVNKSNTYEDVKGYAYVQPNTRQVDNKIDFSGYDSGLDNKQVILGLKNVTKEAGSTELTYLLKKALEEVYKKSVIALEVDKHDLVFFNEPNMYSVQSNKLGEFFASQRKVDVVLVDLNYSSSTSMCTDVIYIVEPSLYRVNQLMMGNRNAFNSLKGKKVILNKNLLSDNDVSVFAKEAGVSIYFSIPPLNDRVYNPILGDLLSKLGIIGVGEVAQEKPKKGFFGLFK